MLDAQVAQPPQPQCPPPHRCAGPAPVSPANHRRRGPPATHLELQPVDHRRVVLHAAAARTPQAAPWNPRDPRPAAPRQEALRLEAASVGRTRATSCSVITDAASVGRASATSGFATGALPAGGQWRRRPARAHAHFAPFRARLPTGGERPPQAGPGGAGAAAAGSGRPRAGGSRRSGVGGWAWRGDGAPPVRRLGPLGCLLRASPPPPCPIIPEFPPGAVTPSSLPLVLSLARDKRFICAVVKFFAPTL